MIDLHPGYAPRMLGGVRVFACERCGAAVVTDQDMAAHDDHHARLDAAEQRA